MINTIFFGINVLLLIAIWQFMLKKTISDHYRDQLFDLRDGVREYFVSKDIPLDSVPYKNLRDLLNGHLRFMERTSLVKFVFLESVIKDNDELQEYLKANIENHFATPDKDLKRYISEVREKARLILLNYMVNSSGLSWLFAVIMSPLIVTWKILVLTWKGLNAIRLLMASGFATFAGGVVGGGSTFIKAAIFVVAINSPVKWTVKKDLLEECSYRMGTETGRYALGL